MRIGYYFVIALALTCQAHALETAAGTDTVNTSQVGINAKIDAGNAIVTSGMNQILQCNQQGKLYSSATNTCNDPTEPRAHKIADCTTAHQFYNQTTGQCESSAPDLSTQLANATTLLNKVVACNVQGQFFNGSSCVAANTGGTKKTYYQCPVNINGAGGDWESIGCIGQIGNQSICTNYNYNHGLVSKSYPCTPITLRVN